MMRFILLLAMSISGTGASAAGPATVPAVHAPQALFQPLTPLKAKRGPAQYASEVCGTADDLPQAARYGSLKTKRGTEFKVSIVSLCQVARLFAEVASQPHIPFRYPEDGCYARAHEMSRILESEGIITGKVFIEGNLRVETKNSPTGYVEWWYHVAPVLIVDRHGLQDVAVLDPSIFDRAVTVEEWFQIQTKHQGGRRDKTYTTNRFAYTPANQDEDLNDYNPEDLANMESTMENYLKIQKERDDARVRAEEAAP